METVALDSAAAHARGGRIEVVLEQARTGQEGLGRGHKWPRRKNLARRGVCGPVLFELRLLVDPASRERHVSCGAFGVPTTAQTKGNEVKF